MTQQVESELHSGPKNDLQEMSTTTSTKSESHELDLEYSPESPVDPKELDQVYRQLDIRIIPALWCLYFLESFGGSAYGNTLTMNYEKGHSLKLSLGLSAHHTSIASALVYVGIIVFDVPMNLAMTKLSPQVWLSRIIVSVGLCYTCYTALKGPGGLIAIRFITGICGAGTWPGMSYYISLWYPGERSTRRIGYYFTAAQLSASAAGLVCAGFQKMDGVRGWYGWQWMYLVYGCITIVCGFTLLWWLPDRPRYLSNQNQSAEDRFMSRIGLDKFNFLPKATQPLNERQRKLHKQDMLIRYKRIQYGVKDVWNIFIDPRLWPLIIMYFGVVGTGFGLAVFGTTIIHTYNPSLSGIDLSLLYAPIWLFDLAAILLITPFADKFPKWRPLLFSLSTLIIITGLLVCTYAHDKWSKYGGLLIAGFGLGPTVPITMAWTAEIFTPRHGDVGCAVSSALVSGLGNLGSVTATYALYSGWSADAARLYRDSNMMLVLMLGVSILASGFLVVLRWKLGDFKPSTKLATSTAF
ncbi:unnamed protein product [Kuraishia capsulata CBS 1993]|uniref:Major facilitator superfamily (MFS) profile domain-containing protein n=1 Tax=Kuraishia capsulata CBS 1993 TaxID=1382522 RepID=W6MMA3_9ASCO|nr:uncharacterized protein KUCA_T00003645001 [Kuraishia capsulata CBS 1993]CDK27666.1 unnamed protein product [Kuraishia capsulata CBS 1993]